ncbi:MAG TPA: Gfo/Idh/MocA family oxidoreductase [Microvirga sp.]|jgi:predicted dehydrogenase|nr:Gfo/Idh/MocA family oxidoreductase [Microvirga sp.]
MARGSSDGLGIGLIGTGYMGKCHALAWNGVAPVFGDVARPRLAVLCDATDDLARRHAQAFGFDRATSDWRALVEDPDVDVVSITTPNALHAEMAIHALRCGKHVWCEKPMAPALADAERMAAAARASGRVAVLGYNYIQNPVVRLMKALIDEGRLGPVNHVRIEMDEDFMADPEAPFSLKSGASSGYGALDDFGVHGFSLIQTLLGPVARACGHMAKPYPDRPTGAGSRRPVETADIASALIELESGASGIVTFNRSAWGRKGRIFVQVFGSKGTLVFDQERFNEVQLFLAEGASETQGFRTILAGPVHAPYGQFIPAPGHSLGFNDLKVIECRELIARIQGKPSLSVDFEAGLRIEHTVHAVAASARQGTWVQVAPAGA